MTDLNGINPKVNFPTDFGQKQEKPEEKQEEKTAQVKPETFFLSGEDVLSFMAANSQINLVDKSEKAKKTIEVSKYVTSEQAKRIGSFVASFEGYVVDALESMENEFSGIQEFSKLTDTQKQDVAVTAFNMEKMPDIVEAGLI